MPSCSFRFDFVTGVLNVSSVTNTVTVKGHDDENTLAQATASHTLTVTNVAPGITVSKTGPASIVEGNTATYTFTTGGVLGSAASLDLVPKKP